LIKFRVAKARGFNGKRGTFGENPMPCSIAYLGPPGTNTETAALRYAQWLSETRQQEAILCPCSSIAQTLQSAARGEVDFAVVPVENSIEGSVTMTLDALWQLDRLQIHHALVLPIVHALISYAAETSTIQTIYSHPQALAQCQNWLEQYAPQAQLIPTSSTTDALQHLSGEPRAGAVSSPRAAKLYDLPILACPINDHSDNDTRFWVVSLQPSEGGKCTSLAFSVHDTPGALVKPLQALADRTINLSRIESRPTKRSLGEYLFFIDLEADEHEPAVQLALETVAQFTETLKVFGSYNRLP
jgi:prephenate dehydratase